MSYHRAGKTSNPKKSSKSAQQTISKKKQILSYTEIRKRFAQYTSFIWDRKRNYIKLRGRWSSDDKVHKMVKHLFSEFEISYVKTKEYPYEAKGHIREIAGKIDTYNFYIHKGDKKQLVAKSQGNAYSFFFYKDPEIKP